LQQERALGSATLIAYGAFVGESLTDRFSRSTCLLSVPLM